MKVVGKVFVGIISFILSVGICMGIVFSAAVLSVREVYDSEFIDSLIEEVDFGAIEFLDSDGHVTSLAKIAEEGLAIEGLFLSEDNIDPLIRYFSIDDILDIILQGWREWLFEYGAVPEWDVYELADVIVDGLGQDVYGFTTNPEDLREALAGSVSAVLASVDSGRIARVFEPVRVILSSGAMAISFTAVMVLVLFLLTRLSFGRTGVLLGTAGVCGGLVLSGGVWLVRENIGYIAVSLLMAKSTAEILFIPLLDFIGRVGCVTAAVSGFIMVLGIIILLFGKRRRLSRGKN